MEEHDKNEDSRLAEGCLALLILIGIFAVILWGCNYISDLVDGIKK